MKCKSRCISILDTCDVDNQALIVLLSTFLVLIVFMLVICWSYILLLCISKRKEIVSRQDGSNNDLLNWQNRRRRRQARVTPWDPRLCTCAVPACMTLFCHMCSSSRNMHQPVQQHVQFQPICMTLFCHMCSSSKNMNQHLLAHLLILIFSMFPACECFLISFFPLYSTDPSLMYFIPA